MKTRPGISCMCLTYGRPARIVEEAIESFLRQDYNGPKELIVLNDYGGHDLSFSHPEVHIINVSKRFRSVGEKRNAAAALCSNEILFVWDDDDIYLPHRLEYTVEKMLNEKRFADFFKPSKALILNKGQLSGPKSNLFHSGSAWTREFFDRVNGYPHINSGQDWGLERKFEEDDKYEKRNFNAIPPEEIFYIYRWAGTGTFHLSGFGKDRPGEESGSEKVQKYVEQKVEQGLIAEGRIELRPAWECDYEMLARDYTQTLHAA